MLLPAWHPFQLPPPPGPPPLCGWSNIFGLHAPRVVGIDLFEKLLHDPRTSASFATSAASISATQKVKVA